MLLVIHMLIVFFFVFHFLINVGEYFQAAMLGFEKDSHDVVRVHL
jgi:hypothetical protein